MLLTVGPVFTIHPMNQEEVINNSFTVECTAEGFPTPSIQWYHNNTMITNSSVFVDNVKSDMMNISVVGEYGYM